MAESRAINFGAGPCALPHSVLEEASKSLLNFNGTGIGIAEISHRSKEFGQVISEFESLIREQLQVPSTHVVLFSQGGGTGQFSSIVLNLLARHRLLYPSLSPEERYLDYVVTGSWSKSAADEAKRLGGGNVKVVVDSRESSKDGKSFDNIPTHDKYEFSKNPAVVYYCENETVQGVQFDVDPSSSTSFPYHLLPKDDPDLTSPLIPLVADYSSSFMSRPIPRLADHAVIFAGAQKNIGPAGLTVMIVRKDCIVDVDAAAKLGAAPVPKILSYKTLYDGKNVPNTPATISLYISKLVLQDMKEKGGLQYFGELSKIKAKKVYDALKRGEDKGGVFEGKIKEGNGRSLMNVVFGINGEGAEARFLEGAERRGLKGLKGHRSVGGIRVSLYNALSEKDADTLVQYMDEFVEAEQAR
ncbi:phosphoserine aminotransferase [Pluteus cervinus]|uniref:Phosphoserine aminotransferase n=1 Tax=Pluteus cervinus TaxID=181527 RepID=A0ACD3B1R6_9AGAR|nr:phosphoserine aminotransferase [Pluteus cervinus]